MNRFTKAIELAEESGRLRGILTYIRDRLEHEECQYPEECKPNKPSTRCAVCEVYLVAEEALAEKGVEE